MKKKVIVFDFDGTIADSLDAIIRIMNKVSGAYGYNKITQISREKFRNKSSQAILAGFNISKIKLVFLIRRIKNELGENITDIPLVGGMKATLKRLSEQGYVLGIASSNSKNIVENFLTNHKLDMFDFIYAKTVFSKSKLIKSIIKDKNLNPKMVYYVGDETRDVEAARKADVKIISVTWGVNSREVLLDYHPDYVIDKPDQIINILEIKA